MLDSAEVLSLFLVDEGKNSHNNRMTWIRPWRNRSSVKIKYNLHYGCISVMEGNHRDTTWTLYSYTKDTVVLVKDLQYPNQIQIEKLRLC